MLWLICYDIQSDRVRSRVARTLEHYGERIQYSVFECILTKEERKGIQLSVGSGINTKTDSVVWVPLCVHDQKRRVRMGLSSKLERIQNSFLV